MKILTEVLNFKSLLTVPVGVAAGTSGVVGVFLTNIYGVGNLYWIYAFLAVIILDWLAGVAASKKDLSYASEYGINGIIRTVFILALPAGANIFDQALGTPGFLFYTVTGGLVYHTWNSMTANVARAGWEKWIPASLLKSVASEIAAKDRRALQRKDPNKDVKK